MFTFNSVAWSGRVSLKVCIVQFYARGLSCKSGWSVLDNLMGHVAWEWASAFQEGHESVAKSFNKKLYEMTRRYSILLYKVVLCAQPKKYFAVSKLSLWTGVWSISLWWPEHVSWGSVERKRIFTYMLTMYNTVALSKYWNGVENCDSCAHGGRELWLVCPRRARIVPTVGELFWQSVNLKLNWSRETEMEQG